MLKICILLDDFYKTNGTISNNINRWKEMLSLSHHFPKWGIIRVEKPEDSDIIIFTKPPIYKKNQLKIYNKPIILAVKYDSAVIPNNKYVIYPEVIAVFKDFNIRNKICNNLPRIGNRYHYKLIFDAFNIKPIDVENDPVLENINQNKSTEVKYPLQIEKKYLYKIKTVPWNLSFTIHYPKSRKYIDSFEIPKTKWDVFMVKHHRNTVCGYARKIARENVLNIKGITKCVDKLTPNEYFENLVRSKICIACWGLGERIADDLHAIAAGVILVKPDSDYVEAFPDIYQNNKYYVACKPDYSNIEDIIKHILQNYDSYKIMINNARTFLLKHKVENYAKEFCKQIKLSWKEYKKN